MQKQGSNDDFAFTICTADETALKYHSSISDEKLKRYCGSYTVRDVPPEKLVSRPVLDFLVGVKRCNLYIKNSGIGDVYEVLIPFLAGNTNDVVWKSDRDSHLAFQEEVVDTSGWLVRQKKTMSATEKASLRVVLNFLLRDVEFDLSPASRELIHLSIRLAYMEDVRKDLYSDRHPALTVADIQMVQLACQQTCRMCATICKKFSSMDLDSEHVKRANTTVDQILQKIRDDDMLRKAERDADGFEEDLFISLSENAGSFLPATMCAHPYFGLIADDQDAPKSLRGVISPTSPQLGDMGGLRFQHGMSVAKTIQDVLGAIQECHSTSQRLRERHKSSSTQANSRTFQALVEHTWTFAIPAPCSSESDAETFSNDGSAEKWWLKQAPLDASLRQGSQSAVDNSIQLRASELSRALKDIYTIASMYSSVSIFHQALDAHSRKDDLLSSVPYFQDFAFTEGDAKRMVILAAIFATADAIIRYPIVGMDAPPAVISALNPSGNSDRRPYFFSLTTWRGESLEDRLKTLRISDPRVAITKAKVLSYFKAQAGRAAPFHLLLHSETADNDEGGPDGDKSCKSLFSGMDSSESDLKEGDKVADVEYETKFTLVDGSERQLQKLPTVVAFTRQVLECAKLDVERSLPAEYEQSLHKDSADESGKESSGSRSGKDGEKKSKPQKNRKLEEPAERYSCWFASDWKELKEFKFIRDLHVLVKNNMEPAFHILRISELIDEDSIKQDKIMRWMHWGDWEFCSKWKFEIPEQDGEEGEEVRAVEVHEMEGMMEAIKGGWARRIKGNEGDNKRKGNHSDIGI